MPSTASRAALRRERRGLPVQAPLQLYSRRSLHDCDIRSPVDALREEERGFTVTVPSMTATRGVSSPPRDSKAFPAPRASHSACRPHQGTDPGPHPRWHGNPSPGSSYPLNTCLRRSPSATEGFDRRHVHSTSYGRPHSRRHLRPTPSMLVQRRRMHGAPTSLGHRRPLLRRTHSAGGSTVSAPSVAGPRHTGNRARRCTVQRA